MKPADLPEQAGAAAASPSTLQWLYAAVLARCAQLGTAALLLAFAADVFGLLPARVAHDRLPALWGLPARRYAELAAWPTGWHWLSLIRQGDLADLLGIAVLCAGSACGVLAVLPHYVRRGDRAYVGICVALLAVLVAAASGLTA